MNNDFFVTHDQQEGSALFQAPCKAALRTAIDYLVDRNFPFECDYPYLCVLSLEDAADLVRYLQEDFRVYEEFIPALAIA